MSTPAEIAASISGWRLRDEREHPPGLYQLVLEWLNDPDEDVRHEAVQFIGRHLHQLSDAQTLLEMVTADPSASMRKTVADCLGGVFRNTHDRRVLSVLAAVSKDTGEDGQVRAAALGAIRRINGQRY
jgi:hypothetical protein